MPHDQHPSIVADRYPRLVTAPSLRIQPGSVLALPEFRALLGARGLGALGMSAIATVVAFQTYQITGEPLALGVLGLVEAIPALGLMLFGGHVADRRDRRTIILVTGALLALGTLVLAVISVDPDAVGFGGILVVVFLIGVAAGFERPALSAFEAQVIPIEHATRGASWNGTVWTTGAIVGPAAGGLAIAVVGIPATYLAIAVLLAVSVWCVSRIARKPRPRPEAEAHEGLVASLTSGVRYVAGNQVLLGAMALDLFAVFFGGAIALLPVYASDILMVGPVGLGVLRTAPSVGALVAMLATTRIPPGRRAGPIFLVCVAIFGVSMLVFGLSTSFPVALGALFVAGLADGVSMVIRQVILRVESPEAMRGRIASVNYVFIGASNELGAFESGVAATLFGVVPSVVGGGLVTLGVVAGVAFLLPELRRLDLARRMIDGPGAVTGPASGGTGTSLPPEVEAAEVERLATGAWGGAEGSDRD
jgi:MFS family permease